MTAEEETFEMSDNESGGGSEEEVETEELSGWADSMSKILKSTKPKNKKNLMLSRAKKDYEVNRDVSSKPKKANDIEIAKDENAKDGKDDDGNVKQETEEDSSVLSIKQQRKLELRQRKLERAWENLNRLTTENPDREMEVNLLKIATKGVVQLFNAVSQQQKTIKSKLRASSKSEFKKDKVLSQSKDLFDKAMSKNRIVDLDGEDDYEEDNQREIKEESSSDEERDNQKDSRKRKVRSTKTESSSKKPMWQALQDDFMLDAKLKDWDKDSDSD